MKIKLILFLCITLLAFNASANVRYSVFINEFKLQGGSEAGVAIIQDMAKQVNTAKAREEYKKRLDKLVPNNNVEIKCPYCYLEALEAELVTLLKAEKFDSKLYNRILKESMDFKYELAKNYIGAFEKMTLSDRVAASKTMEKIYYESNMLDVFESLQKQSVTKAPIEPRS